MKLSGAENNSKKIPKILKSDQKHCKMATQKPGEWANSLLVRFDEQVCENKNYSAVAEPIYNFGQFRSFYDDFL